MGLALLLLTVHAGAQQIAPKSPQPPLALINGKVYRRPGIFSEAILIKGRTIAAVGDDEEILSAAPPDSRVINLKGATVTPGLIDSHIHAVRAGLTYSVELDWSNARTIKEALAQIAQLSAHTPPSQWVIVAGGWSPDQFAERRKPTLQEIEAVSNNHPVYIQYLYDSVLLSSQALKILLSPAYINARHSAQVLSRLSSEQAPTAATDWLSGSSRAISDLYNLLPQPKFKDTIQGTKAFFLHLNQLGLTGVLDPGGYNLSLDAYKSVKLLARRNELTLKLRLNLCAPRRGTELADFKRIVKSFTRSNTPSFLLLNGVGENVTWAMYNNENPTDQQKEELAQTLLWAAKHSINVTLHWNNNDSVHHLLDVLEEVNNQYPIAPLRWSIAHLADASVQTLGKMRELGVGWTVQDNFYYTAATFILHHGEQSLHSIPRIQTALDLGINVALGTDAHRVMSYNPFISLEWALNGKGVSGLISSNALQRPSREQALALYTQNSAWFSFEDNTRGLIEPGFDADIIVLDKDYFTIPVEDIHSIVSTLTVVDGKIVYRARP